MTPAQFKSARETLGLSQASLASLLQMGGDGERTVRRWEVGERRIPGPVAVLMRLFSARPALMELATQSNLRSDINAALNAIVTNSSSHTRPETTMPYMTWFYESDGILYFRDKENDAWIAYARMDQNQLVPISLPGSAR
jgi:transcriptional regulator with XRE-family HTH domain